MREEEGFRIKMINRQIQDGKTDAGYGMS